MTTTRSSADDKTAGEKASQVDAASLPVRDGEDPWTDDEVAEVRQTLTEDIDRFASQTRVPTAAATTAVSRSARVA